MILAKCKKPDQILKKLTQWDFSTHRITERVILRFLFEINIPHSPPLTYEWSPVLLYSLMFSRVVLLAPYKSWSIPGAVELCVIRYREWISNCDLKHCDSLLLFFRFKKVMFYNIPTKYCEYISHQSKKIWGKFLFVYFVSLSLFMTLLLYVSAIFPSNFETEPKVMLQYFPNM